MTKDPGPDGWVALFGDPVGHSLSAVIHNAGFDAVDLSCRYETRHVSPERLPAAVLEARRDPRCLGFNLTIPHKETVLPLLDRVTDDARRVGAVNTVWREDRQLVGGNTDGQGFVRTLERLGFVPRDRRVLVMGAGGAARAVVFALVDAGARVQLVNRTRGRAQRLAQAAGVAVSVVGSPSRAPDAVDLVVQATSLGTHALAGTEPWSRAAGWFDQLPWDRWCGAPPLALDLVYRPPITPFLDRARQIGCHVENGLEMLLFQGALGFERWTGRDAPIEVMRQALRAAATTRP